MISTTLRASNFSAGGCGSWRIRSSQASSTTRVLGAIERAGGGPPA
jgi:hypothetical protein